MPASLSREVDIDTIGRRVMFALELVDPVTRRLVSKGIKPSIAGMPPPLKGPGGRFVWLETEVPARRDIKVELEISNSMFGMPSAQDLTFPGVPANDDTVRPDALLRRVELPLSSHYVPPDGITGVASIVVEDGPRSAPLAGLGCALCFIHDHDSRFTSKRIAVSDGAGGFTAFADDLDDIVPRPTPPKEAGDVYAWLRLTRPAEGGAVRFSGFLPLRRGRLTQLREPVSWATATAQPPEPKPD